jgi:ribosome biogenesis protein UTP30
MGAAAADVKLPGYSGEQVQKAATSLLKFVGDRKGASNDLFDDDEVLNLSIALKMMPLQSRKDKPIPLVLPNPIHALEGAEVCLFVKDHKGEGHKEGKEAVQKFEKNGGIAKVIGISKLKTKYESHEAKRQLCKMFDLFLADERIVPSLPKLIGKAFFKVRTGRMHALTHACMSAAIIRRVGRGCHAHWETAADLGLDLLSSLHRAEKEAAHPHPHHR